MSLNRLRCKKTISLQMASFIIIVFIVLLYMPYGASITGIEMKPADRKPTSMSNKTLSLARMQRILGTQGWTLDSHVKTNSFPISAIILENKKNIKPKETNAAKCNYSWVISPSFDPISISANKKQPVNFGLAMGSETKEIQYRLPSGVARNITVSVKGATKGDAVGISSIVSTDHQTLKRVYLAEEIISFADSCDNEICSWHTGVIKLIVFSKVQKKKK